MQIVIDIPNSTFTDLKKKQNRTEVDVAVLNGTPLPKGHGDLIDRSKLLKESMDTANYPSNYVRIAKAIIKADKTESEEV